MHIYLIRHGHRADQESGYTGGSNPPLSSLGFEQAEHMAEYMAKESIDALYCSSMLRAIQTARPLQEKTGLPLQVWPAFCETPVRTWREFARENDPRAQLTAAWRTGEMPPVVTEESMEAAEGHYYLLSSLPETFPGTELSQPLPWPDAWWTALEGGCRETAFVRIELGIAALLERHAAGENIAVVGHGNSGDMMLTLLLGLSRDAPRRFHTLNTSIFKVAIDEHDKRMLVFANQVQHLPEEKRT